MIYTYSAALTFLWGIQVLYGAEACVIGFSARVSVPILGK